MTQLSALFDLRGQRALVTGGAGGIGAACCRLLGEAGATVVVADRDSTRAQEVAGALGKAGIEADAFELDVTDEAAVSAAFSALDERGGIDILINNAGISIRKALTDLSLAEWDRVFAVNATGAFLMSRAAAPGMKARQRGAIVNVASIMGLSGGGPYPNPSYQASKGALVNLTRALAVELAPAGIRVNAVAPTWVRTEFIGELSQNAAALQRIEALMPMQRIAEAAEVAATVLFLASPASSMTTGAVVPVDGGFLAQ